MVEDLLTKYWGLFTYFNYKSPNLWFANFLGFI
jgi:hypothetical protein